MAAGTLWDQFAALLPDRPAYDPAHPLGCHRRRTADRIVSGKLLQVRSVIGTVGWRATNPRRSMLLWLVKGSDGIRWSGFPGSGVLCSELLDGGQDREGPLVVEGKLLASIHRGTSGDRFLPGGLGDSDLWLAGAWFSCR
jgi:hypothetical protein